MNHIYITPQEYETAAKIGITPSQLNQRVRAGGWEIERAITTPMRSPRNKFADLARKNGISASSYCSRVNRYGWSPERAATTPPKPTKQWAEWYAVIDKTGLSRSMFYQRVKHLGWDPEKAATTPPTPNDGSRRKGGWR